MNFQETEPPKKLGGFFNAYLYRRGSGIACKAVTEDAINHYWHYVVKKLERTDLGDIEKANLELDKQRLDDLLTRFRGN